MGDQQAEINPTSVMFKKDKKMFKILEIEYKS